MISIFVTSWNSELFICVDEDLQCCRQSVFWWRHAECLLLWSYWKVDPYPRARWLWRLLDNQETENDISFFCCKKRLLWMFQSSFVCLEILADLTSFTSNSNDGFVRVFSVAAAPQKWSCLIQLKTSHFVQKSRPTSLSVRPIVMLQSFCNPPTMCIIQSQILHWQVRPQTLLLLSGICLPWNPQVGMLVRVRIQCPSSCPPRDMAVFATPSNLEFTSSHSQSLDLLLMNFWIIMHHLNIHV